MSKCEGGNLSQFNNTCANISNEFISVELLRLLYSILDQFVYVVSPIGLIMNILNIVAIANAPTKLSPHSKFVISLAVSDMCILLPSLVTRLARTLLFQYDIYECFSTIAYSYLEPCVTLVSLFNLLALGIDHFIAIIKPLHYKRIVTNSRVSACIVLIWSVSFVTSAIETIPEIINYYKKSKSYLKTK